MPVIRCNPAAVASNLPRISTNPVVNPSKPLIDAGEPVVHLGPEVS
jgi:hypothetical protein